MLRFITHARQRQTMRPYLERWAGAYAEHIDIVSYDELFRAPRVPRCVHVFTDLERLDETSRERAAHVWNAIHAAAPDIRLLNHPLRGMLRYQLLRTLRENGINDFDAYRLVEARKPAKFPVFIRSENDHAGPESELLHSQEALDAAIKALCRAGKSRETRIFVEFNAEADADGRYRKYGAFHVDGEVIPRHLVISPTWVTKDATRILDEAALAEEARYLEENPHVDWVRRVFRLACLDYGRIDYTIVAGRLQAFEINTNPAIIQAETTAAGASNDRFAVALNRAFAKLEATVSAGKPVHISTPLTTWRARLVSHVLGRVFRRQLRQSV